MYMTRQKEFIMISQNNYIEFYNLNNGIYVKNVTSKKFSEVTYTIYIE
jgi:hypothetical protein